MIKIIILNNLFEDEIKNKIADLGIKSYRADQIFRAIHKQGVMSFDELNQVSKTDIELLKKEFTINSMKILKDFHSKQDETIKLLYLLEDNNIIEGVLMKYKHGYSLCVSTQVGCRMGCDFCASTKKGLERNLEAFEIASQIYLVEKYFSINLSSIVLMGSGEPFDNYDNVIRALKLLNDKKGRNLSLRNMTVSTCGVADKIIAFGKDLPQANLAVSVHSFNNEIRNKVMPVNYKYPIDTLFSAIRDYLSLTNNRISIEYTVIPGENNNDEDVNLFRKYLKNTNYIVNLIALNPINAYNKEYKEEAKIFMEKLKANNINVTLRRELGSDISASCGQLKKSYLEEGERKWNS